MREQYIQEMRSRSNAPGRPSPNRMKQNASVPNFQNTPGKSSMVNSQHQMSPSPSKFNQFSNVGMQMMQGQNSSIPTRVYP